MIADLKTTRAAPAFAVKCEWAVVRLWEIARIRSEKNHPELPLLSVFLNRGVIAYGEGGGQVHKPGLDLSIYQVVRRGDFVLNNQQAWRGSVGVSKHEGIISPAYVVLALREVLNPRFADYLFQSRDMVAQYVTSSKGVGDIQRDIHIPWLKNVKVPLPTPAEQAEIARFLDWANGRLERAIRAKWKVIALLNEQRQAIIHRAVTFGLDPSVPLKHSGIPWLDQIPQHWEVRPIKRWTKINVLTLGQGTDPDLELRYIDIGAVRTGYLVRAPEVMRFANAPSRARRVLVAGDTIVSTVRTYLKAVWFVGQMVENLIASTGFAVFSPNPELEPEYLHYVLQDASFVDQVTANSIGIAYPAIAETVLARFRVAIPPSRDEQRDVITAIKIRTRPLTTAISRLEREIDLLREYRNRLVADVVTGKLDVHETAVRLPDEVPPETVEDDSDQGDEAETADEEAAV